MKKKPVENTSTVHDEELIIHDEELTIKLNEKKSVNSPESEDAVTSKNVVKTRH